METPFAKHMKSKYPNLDIEKAISIFDDNISQIQVGSLEENKEIRMPLGCDLNKNIFIKTLSEYNQSEYSLGDRVTTEYYYHGEVFTVVGIRKDELELRGDWSGGTHNVDQIGWYPKNKCKKY